MLLHSSCTLFDGEDGKTLCWETIARAIAGEKLFEDTVERIHKRLAAAEVEWGVQ